MVTMEPLYEVLRGWSIYADKRLSKWRKRVSTSLSWGYHNRQNEDYLYFTDITFVFLSLFSATVTSNVRNGKSQVVLT